MNHYNSLVALSQIPYLVKLRSKMNLDCCWEEDVVVFVSFNVSLFKKQRFMLIEDCTCGLAKPKCFKICRYFLETKNHLVLCFIFFPILLYFFPMPLLALVF